MGETVRLAERLESTCESGGILVCPRTAAEPPATPSRTAPSRRGRPRRRRARRARRSTPRPRPAGPSCVRASAARRRCCSPTSAGSPRSTTRLPPERLKALLDRCFVELEAAVRSHGGVVDKYVGECLMALFGVPNAIEHAPRQALNAAIDLRRRLAAFQEDPEVRAALPVPLTLQIGINTGLVIAGEVGGRTKRGFTVMGDAVNLAARLRDAAGDGDVWVGAETHRATAAEFAFEALEPLRLKGKANPQPVFALRSSREQTPPHAARGRRDDARRRVGGRRARRGAGDARGPRASAVRRTRGDRRHRRRGRARQVAAPRRAAAARARASRDGARGARPRRRPRAQLPPLRRPPAALGGHRRRRRGRRRDEAARRPRRHHARGTSATRCSRSSPR